TANPRTSAMSPQRMCKAPLPAKRGPVSVMTSATKKSRRFLKMFCIGRTSIRPCAAQWPMFSKISGTSSARACRTVMAPLACGGSATLSSAMLAHLRRTGGERPPGLVEFGSRPLDRGRDLCPRGASVAVAGVHHGREVEGSVDVVVDARLDLPHRRKLELLEPDAGVERQRHQ